MCSILSDWQLDILHVIDYACIGVQEELEKRANEARIIEDTYVFDSVMTSISSWTCRPFTLSVSSLFGLGSERTRVRV